jgi:hypothetical protein
MDNDSVFSGVTARPAREVADALHSWEHGGNPAFSYLVGAVASLAREVDRITPQVIDHDGGPTPGRVPVYRPPVSQLPDIELRYNALLVGLSELLNMIRYADDNRASADATLTAVAARVAGMIDTHKPASDADTVC